MTDYARLVSELRPVERRVLKWHDAGVDRDEIARRFRRSPAHIDRILRLAQLPDRDAEAVEHEGVLRPLERRVLRWREQGLEHEEIARRFRRSPEHIRRIEGLARYRQSLDLLGSD